MLHWISKNDAENICSTGISNQAISSCFGSELSECLATDHGLWGSLRIQDIQTLTKGKEKYSKLLKIVEPVQ